MAGYKSPTTQYWAPLLRQSPSLGQSVPAWWMLGFLSSLLPEKSHSVAVLAEPGQISGIRG